MRAQAPYHSPSRYYPLAANNLTTDDGMFGFRSWAGLQYTAGRNGGANAAINTSAGYLLGPRPNFTGTTGLTIDMWVQWQGFSATWTEVLFDMRQNPGSDEGYWCYYNARTGRLFFGDEKGNFSAPWTSTAGTWTRLTFVIDPSEGERRIYVDGQEVAGTEFGYTVPGRQSLEMTIGTSKGSTPQNFYFNGDIDDLSIWERPLTDAEVATIWTGPDTQAPSAPTDFQYVYATPTTASVTWTAATDNVAVTEYAYEIAGVTTTTANPEANLTGLAEGTAYTLRVEAIDAAGNRSPVTSFDFTHTSVDTQAPSAVTDLRAYDHTGGTFFRIDWTAATDNVGVTDYLVVIDPVNSTFATRDSLYTGSTRVSPSGRIPNTAYEITVKAIDAAGNIGAGSTILTRTGYTGGINSTGLTERWLFSGDLASTTFGRAFAVSDRSNATHSPTFTSGRLADDDAVRMHADLPLEAADVDLDYGRSFTISMWARLEEHEDGGRFVLLDGQDAQTAHGLFAGFEAPSLATRNGQVSAGNVLYAGSSAGLWAFNFEPIPYRYHHYVFTFDTDNERVFVYVDGHELVLADPGPGVPPTPWTPIADRPAKTLTLGHPGPYLAGLNTPWQPLPGSFDELYVYQRAFSDSDAQAFYADRDAQAPSLTDNYRAGAITATSIELNWDQIVDNVGMQDVWQLVYGPDPLDQTIAFVTGQPTTTITGLDPNTAYTFRLRAIDFQGNRGTENELTVTTTGSSSADEPAFAKTLRVGPNPVRGGDAVRVTGVPAGAQVSLVNALGQTVLASVTHEGEVPTAGLQAGLYSLRIAVPGEGAVTRRVMVE